MVYRSTSHDLVFWCSLLLGWSGNWRDAQIIRYAQVISVCASLMCATYCAAIFRFFDLWGYSARLGTMSVVCEGLDAFVYPGFVT